MIPKKSKLNFAPEMNKAIRCGFMLAIFYFPLSGSMQVIAGQTANPTGSDTDTIIVGTRVVPPFVIKKADSTYTGLTISLMNHISSELDIDFEYREEDIEGMLQGIAVGKYFASASAISITSEREKTIDFTHPYFVSGLGIAVSYQPAGLLESVLAIFSSDFLWVVFLLAVLLLFWGFLVWLFERKENREEFGGTAVEGIGNGFWWAAVTMTTVGYGDKSPRTPGGRIVAFIWMFTAIIVISFFTASIASSLTVNQLSSSVSGPQDLPQARVGTLQNSATETYLQNESISFASFATIEKGLQAVADDQIDAFVHDSPIMRYYVQRDYKNSVRVLPDSFNKQFYGIVLPSESQYRDQINRIILDYIKTSEWNQLLSEYMGEVNG